MTVSRFWCLLVCIELIGNGFALAGDWPQWRGADRTDVSTETGLLKEWPKEGPKQLWVSDKAGLGYSGYAIVAGKLFTMGAIEEAEFLLCFDANTGAELWSTKLGPVLNNDWGNGPRSTPTVNGTMVYALGGTGILVCANVADGKEVWRKTIEEFGGKRPNWGYCESVTVDGMNVIFTPGGEKGAIVALNKENGDVVWQSKDLTDGAQYASIVPAVVNGEAQYIQLFQQTLAAVSPKDGSLLWKAPWPGKVAVIPTPVVSANQIFVTSGYGVGCTLVEINADHTAKEVYFNKTMKNHHGGVVLFRDHIYGHSDGGGWVCMDFKTGEVAWNEKSALGKGCVACADGMLYCVDEGNGDVALVEATPTAYVERSRFKLAPQTSRRKPNGRVWTHPVISNGKLYLRDQELLSCYDVKAR